MAIEIYKRLTSGTDADYVLHATLPDSAHSTVVSGLTANTDYTFKVVGIAPAPVVVTATTLAVAAPAILSFSPTSGAVGAALTITGTNFTGATEVKVNNVAATFTVVSATEINATIPTTTTGKVKVTTPGGTATSTADFTVTVPATPTLCPPTNFAAADGGNGFTFEAVDCNAVSQDLTDFYGVDENNPIMIFGGGVWESPVTSVLAPDYGAYRYSETAGSFYKTKVFASRIKIKAPKTSIGAEFTVTLNGVPFQNGSCLADAADEDSAVIWDSGDIAEDNYEIIVTSLSDGTKRLMVDTVYFINSRSLPVPEQSLSGYSFINNDDPSLVITGSWSTYTPGFGLQNGDQMYSNNSDDASVTANITGTRLKLTSFKDPALGTVAIIIDGYNVAVANENAGSTQNASVIWDSGEIPADTYEVKMVTLRRPVVSISFDAFHYLPV